MTAWTSAETELLVKLIREGCWASLISERMRAAGYDRDEAAVRTRARRMRIQIPWAPARTHGGRLHTAETAETIADMLAAGHTRAEISKALGMSHNAVIGLIYRRGLAGGSPKKRKRPEAPTPEKPQPAVLRKATTDTYGSCRYPGCDKTRLRPYDLCQDHYFAERIQRRQNVAE